MIQIQLQVLKSQFAPDLLVGVIDKFGKLVDVQVVVDTTNKEMTITDNMTGWDENTMKFVAKKFNKKLKSDFSDIKISGNNFFLLH